MNLVGAINKVAEHIALFSSSDHWDAGKLEHCLKAMNMLLAAQSSGGQSPQAPNSRYATALDVVQQYVKEVANSESSKFVDWLYQRLNPAERDSA